MDATLKAQMDEVNKLIFVKKYDAADTLLAEILHSEEGRDEVLIYLRRIELAVKLKKIGALVREYETMLDQPGRAKTANICLVLAQLHEESLAPTEAIDRFQEIVKDAGPNAACYFGIAFSLEIQGNADRAIFNYQQSIAIDDEWYPSYFGLSQLHYQKGDAKNGDHYFYLFESAAPYNVYGNFDTHRKLCNGYIDSELFGEAEAAIRTLGEWWVDHKGFCPPEIQIYENLVMSRISSLRNLASQADRYRAAALTLAQEALDDQDPKEGVLYFIAKALEEFSEFEMAFTFYKKILRVAGGNPGMVQKIGSQFLSMGEYKLAKSLFEEAYDVYPDNPEIRFCVLVSKLRLAGVNVEEYLIGKERLKQLNGNEGDRVEILALLHSLLAKFDEDPDVHHQIGDVYLRLGNTERAGKHYHRMYDLDRKSRATALRFVAYSMQHGNLEDAKKILDTIAGTSKLSMEDDTEVCWLKANYFSRVENFPASQGFLQKALTADPWNVSYLVQEIVNLTKMGKFDEEMATIDSVIRNLTSLDESNLNWQEFAKQTERFEMASAYDIAYARRKLRFLYANGDEDDLKKLITAATRHDPARGSYDIIRLLNTNFDSPLIYTALGILHKELWLLEAASMWFEQALLHPKTDQEQKGSVYLELADCYIWLGRDLQKAIEYGKFALEMGQKVNTKAASILAHAYLKTGQVRQAKVYLEAETEIKDPETQYLKGLLQYRNGARREANLIWKPLLTVKTENLRFHNIKQEILRYYFDGAPYLKVN